ncbi:hypothetical protein ES703_116093 [subsurface metagenome]
MGKCIFAGFIGTIGKSYLSLSFFRGRFGNDIDNTSQGVSSVERREGTSNYLDPFDVLYRKETQIYNSGGGGIQSSSIY